MVPSRTTTSTEAQSTPSTSQRRRSGGAAVWAAMAGAVTARPPHGWNGWNGWNVVMTLLSQRDSMSTMTIDTADYRELPMASTGRDDTRAALLAAAHDLLAKEGPGALTVRRIAAAAGMSTMNVYSRFGGKDGVLDELFIDGFRRMGEEMGETPMSDDPAADLLSCGRSYRRFAKRNPTYYSLMFDRVV